MGLETVRPGRPRHGHCFLINLSLSLSLSLSRASRVRGREALVEKAFVPNLLTRGEGETYFPLPRGFEVEQILLTGHIRLGYGRPRPLARTNCPIPSLPLNPRERERERFIRNNLHNGFALTS